MATQLRRNDHREEKTSSLAVLELTDAQNRVASVTVPEASLFDDFKDIIVQAMLYEDQLTDFAGYKPLVVDIEMYRARNNAGKTQVYPIEVRDLDQEIQVRLPAVKDRDLTCAFFNEASADWESLKCENEQASDEHVTCCTDHLTRFALVPVEYLEIVRTVQKIEEKKIEPEAAAVELSDSGRSLNVKYLIGCICAFVTLVATLFCLGKQIFAFKTEKKRYEQLVRDAQPPSGDDDGVMPTERALIPDDAKQ